AAPSERAAQAGTRIRADLVGVSVVPAITQTPASGPFGPLTTPPISSASIATWPAAAPCWARTGVTVPVSHNPTDTVAIALIATPVRRRLLSVMVSSLRSSLRHPDGIGSTGGERLR